MALGGRLALQRVEFDLFLAGTGRFGLQPVEIRHELALTLLGGIGLGDETGQHFLRLGANLAIDIGKLRLQRADTGMVVEQRRRKVCDIALDLPLPIAQPLDGGGEPCARLAPSLRPTHGWRARATVRWTFPKAAG